MNWKRKYNEVSVAAYHIKSDLERITADYNDCLDENRRIYNDWKMESIGLQAIIDTQKVELARDIEIIRELKGS